MADPHTRQLLIQELLDPNELEMLLKDSFGNYVIQTAVSLFFYWQATDLL